MPEGRIPAGASPASPAIAAAISGLILLEHVMVERYLSRILTSRVYEVATETDLDLAANLSRRLGSRVWLKREDEQEIFSFKIRGAYNKMANLPATALDRGVVAASAGNHAQGVAQAAQRLGSRAEIFMPRTTPQIKIDAVKARGAHVELVGDGFDETAKAARAYCRQHGMTFIPPYDDADVIAGQGTIGFEILKQHGGPLDAIFVPVGGGGLIAGIAVYVKLIRPSVRIVGVEPDDANSMQQALRAGRRVTLRHVGLFADGVAVRQVGREPFRIASRFVDEIITVSADEVCAAIKDVFEDTRSIMEPAGALAVAGLKRYVDSNGIKGGQLVAVTSGANMNFDRLRHVSERAEIGERREGILAVTIPERPGSFRRFCHVVGKRSITEFNYRIADTEAAHIYVGIQVRQADEINLLAERLQKKGYETIDLTDNEVAKLHVRHMVGGRSRHARNEVIYRFQFPERPGALAEFLDRMGESWNISMFHYRNHGTDHGRVLCGIQVPAEDKSAFNDFVRSLGYDYSDETDNPAYRVFLA
jgi:threonine dehydratase